MISLANVGIMRFSESRTAWVMNVQASTQSLQTTVTDLGGRTNGHDHVTTVQLARGRRFYQPDHNRIRSLQTLAVTPNAAAAYTGEKDILCTTSASRKGFALSGVNVRLSVGLYS